jgi:hypothetical protein
MLWRNAKRGHKHGRVSGKNGRKEAVHRGKRPAPELVCDEVSSVSGCGVWRQRAAPLGSPKAAT